MKISKRYDTIFVHGEKYQLSEIDWQTIAPWWKNQNKRADWQISFDDFLQEWSHQKSYVEVQTSGSTGIPKTIRLDKSRMVNSANMTGHFFNFKNNQTALLALPCHYIAGKMMVVRAIVWGLNLLVVPPTSNPLKKGHQKIDFTAMIPMQVKTVLEENPEKISLLRQLIIGGGAVGSILLDQLQNVPTNCYATYGMTETITHIALKKLNGKQSSPYFQALPEVYISQDNRNCLVINAPHLSEQPIITNDIVELTGNRQFKWLGRYDNIINTGAIKVSPEQIEAQLAPLIQPRFFISSQPDERLGERVILIIEDSPWRTQDLKKLQSTIKNQLKNRFEQPRSIYFLPQFQETSTGKVHRHKTKSLIRGL